jgi:hypothetical protein
MHGLRLPEMDASDMLDVLHFMMETDNHQEKEKAVAQTEARNVLYRELYNRTYKYGYSEGKSPQDFDALDDPANGWGDLDDLTPFDPTERRQVKPFVPPTEFDPDSADPFGGLLDGPAGG